MELKAFKGMPHEFGGIDYTEGSEVEGGEFAVQIGKSGNEYIFDKNSSEGERLSKEYKRLDKNGRLTEDDPLALEAFDQIAREEALRHAQRSVNEKGIDPFRNMYDQGGQAANGGVKYAAGGAKDMYFTGGGMGSFGSMMGGIGGGLNMIGDLFKTPDIDFDAMFKGISAGENPNLVNPQRYMNLVSDDSTDMTALKQSMQGERGGETTQSPMDFAAMFKSKEATQDLAEAQQQIDAVPNAISGASGIGGMIGGLIRGNSKAGELKEPVSFRDPGDERSRSQGPEFYKMEGKDYAASSLEGAASGAMTGLQVAGPWGALGGAILGGVVNPIKDNIQENKIQKEATEAFNKQLKIAGEEEMRQSMMNAIAMDTEGTALIDKDRYAGVMRNGGAKPIYGYYADGGGKKEENEVTGVAVTPTGAAYSSDLMSLDNRGVGSTDYGMIPANLEQYARTFFGASEPFTEKDISQQEANALLEVLKKRKEPNTIGYSDFDTVKSQDVYQASMMDLLSNDQNIMRSLLGKAAVKETPDYYEVTSDYDFAKGKSLSDINNTMDLLGYLHNISPFVNRDAVSKKDAINLRIPKN